MLYKSQEFLYMYSWILVANSKLFFFIKANNWGSVLAKWVPPVVLDKLWRSSSEQQAKSCLIRLGPPNWYSSLYWSQVTRNSDHSSAELSSLISGLGNFSGFLSLLPPPWTGWAYFKWLSSNSFDWANSYSCVSYWQESPNVHFNFVGAMMSPSKFTFFWIT